MKKLRFFSIVFGCDPEFFFRMAGQVIGADKILPRSGLEFTKDEFAGELSRGVDTSVGGSNSRIIIDGVQAELNPRPNTCRANIGNEIACCFKKLAEHMKEYKSVGIDFAQTIKLSDDDFDSLSDDSKKFGCMPSKNSHQGGKNGKITVNPATYRFRSAGGHLHIGNAKNSPEVQAVLDNPTRLVQLMDILVGNTCVLIDRDPGNIERRKVYGKAGEFRTPPHGVEYRTLSNFWLRSYQLMSLVMGLARHAVIIVANDMDGEFLKKVNMEDVAEAINTNNFTLALRNFKKIESLLLGITPANDLYPIHSGNIKDFRFFIKKGLDHWFKVDPVKHWVELPEGHNTGFETFLSVEVRKEREAELKA